MYSLLHKKDIVECEIRVCCLMLASIALLYSHKPRSNSPLFAKGEVSKYCQIIHKTKSRGLFDNID